MVRVPGVVAAGRLLVGLVRRHVVEGRPLEEHPARRDVHLLHVVVEHAPAGRPAVVAEVGPPRLVDEQERRVARRDDEVVQVGGATVAGVHGRHPAVALVHDHAGADAHADVLVDATLPPGEHGPPLVALHLEGRRVLSLGHGADPDRLTAPVDDHGAGIAVAGTALGDEVVARRRRRRPQRDRHARRVQVRASDQLESALVDRRIGGSGRPFDPAGARAGHQADHEHRRRDRGGEHRDQARPRHARDGTHGFSCPGGSGLDCPARAARPVRVPPRLTPLPGRGGRDRRPGAAAGSGGGGS